ncbi:MAG: PepSY domain-containing protein [Rhodocyclaceae bacterium]|nr:PepSY domain-containing protein [Rhodocyclaceae bacterium]
MKKLIALAVMLGVSISANAAITAQMAKAIALKSAGGGVITDFDYERKKVGSYYEVEVLNNGVEYEFKIDANTGKILAREVENKNKPTQPGAGNTQPNQPGAGNTQPVNNAAVKISVEQAKQIALRKVGSGRVTEIELERKGATYYYDVEVKDNRGREYEVKINATTGAILSFKRD